MATKKNNPFREATDKGKKQQAAIIYDAPAPAPDTQSTTLEPVAETPKPAVPADSEKVGLNLRITKDRRAFIKSWCALHNVAMNDLFSDIIDQIKDERYNPLGK